MPKGIYERKNTLEIRLWKYVEKTPTCWIWKGAVNDSGYGIIGEGKFKKHRVHHVSWKLAKRIIPEGMLLLHVCDNRRCVLVDHLFLGTHKDNTQDMISKGRAGWQNGNPYFRRSA